MDQAQTPTRLGKWFFRALLLVFPRAEEARLLMAKEKEKVLTQLSVL
jgi:hypothetical protein